MKIALKRIEYNAFPYDTLEEAKESILIGQAILTDNNRFYVVNNSDVECLLPLDYYLVS